MKIKNRLSSILAPALLILVFINTSAHGFSEVIEKIYAVVNGELITYTELKAAEIQMTAQLSQQYKDEELTAKLSEMKSGLMDRMIEQKVLLSFAKDKNYSVDGEVELIIKDVKKQYNLNSDEELIQAMASQGTTLEEFKQQVKESQMQQHYIRESIGEKIKIDNSAIMEYYKNNIKNYTIPLKLSLNCIFLDKANYISDSMLQEKKKIINAELNTTKFEDTAKKYTELQGGDVFLGEFKQGEIDPTLEKIALELKKDDHSEWVETKTGWYIIQLVNKTEPQLVEYQNVREEIEETLRNEETGKRLKDFVQELKKDSHIKIYEKW